MTTVRPLPSVLGCLLGFGFAGCGAGVVPGAIVGGQLRGPVLGPDPPVKAALEWDYGSVYAGSFIGMLTGGALGVRHARRAGRRAAQDAGPGSASDTAAR